MSIIYRILGTTRKLKVTSSSSNIISVQRNVAVQRLSLTVECQRSGCKSVSTLPFLKFFWSVWVFLDKYLHGTSNYDQPLLSTFFPIIVLLTILTLVTDCVYRCFWLCRCSLTQETFSRIFALFFWDTLCSLRQKYANQGSQVGVVSKLCTVLSNISGFSVFNLFYVILLACITLRWFLLCMKYVLYCSKLLIATTLCACEDPGLNISPGLFCDVWGVLWFILVFPDTLTVVRQTRTWRFFFPFCNYLFTNRHKISLEIV